MEREERQMAVLQGNFAHLIGRIIGVLATFARFGPLDDQGTETGTTVMVVLSEFEFTYTSAVVLAVFDACVGGLELAGDRAAFKLRMAPLMSSTLPRAMGIEGGWQIVKPGA